MTEFGAYQNGKPTPEYVAYCQAKARCNNPKNPAFKNYGGRGIRFLFTSFAQFLSEVGRRPEGRLPSGMPLYSIHRIDNDGNYEPGNVKWATQKEQCAPGACRRTCVTKGGGAALRRMREMATLSLDEVENLYPIISSSRLSRAERDLVGLSPVARAGLERVLDAEIRRCAREVNEVLREYDQAVAV
jgi:hypothetical protein